MRHQPCETSSATAVPALVRWCGAPGGRSGSRACSRRRRTQGGTEGPSGLAGTFPSSPQLRCVFPVPCVLNQTMVTDHCTFCSSLIVADGQSSGDGKISKRVKSCITK